MKIKRYGISCIKIFFNFNIYFRNQDLNLYNNIIKLGTYKKYFIIYFLINNYV